MSSKLFRVRSVSFSFLENDPKTSYFFWENDPTIFFGKIKFIKVMTATREAELIIISTYNHALCVCVCALYNINGQYM